MKRVKIAGKASLRHLYKHRIGMLPKFWNHLMWLFERRDTQTPFQNNSHYFPANNNPSFPKAIYIPRTTLRPSVYHSYKQKNFPRVHRDRHSAGKCRLGKKLSEYYLCSYNLSHNGYR